MRSRRDSETLRLLVAACVLAAAVAGCASSGKTPPVADATAGGDGVAPPAGRHGMPTGATVVFTFGETGERLGQFRSPEALAVDLQGNIFVADRLNNRIEKFDHTGKYILQFGTLGSGPGEFNYPVAIAAQQGLYLYVLDQGNERLVKYDLTGNPNGTVLTFTLDKLRSQVGTIRPRGFAIDRTSNIYVSDGERGRVLVFNTFLEYRYDIGSAGSGPGNLFDPRGIVTTEGGDVYVADSGNGRVAVFSSLGGYQNTYALPSGPAGERATPRGLARDAQGMVYVADPATNRVLVLDPHGSVAFTLGGTGPEALDSPSDVAVDGQGRVYVADTGHDRVVVYDLQYPSGR